MRLIDLKIDGFGVWSGLRLDEVSPHLTVFYGPNEAGKTTLMQFVRTMLYGFSTQRRERYLPPVRATKAGGMARVDSPHGRFTLQRHDDPNKNPLYGHLRIAAADGAPQDDRLLATLLTGVDEAIFNNIFACGLREIQELGSLTDTAAADLLYKLSTGLDRVSLVDVTRELTTSRQRLLSSDHRPAQIDALIQKRDQLLTDLEPLKDGARQYGRLLAQRDALEFDISRIEREQAAAEHSWRLLDVALTVRDKWNQRVELDVHLAALAEMPQVPPGSIEDIDRLNERLSKRRRRMKWIVKQRAGIKKEAATITVERTLWRQVPRIEAVLEQQIWVGKIEEDVKQLQAEHSVYQRELRIAADQLAHEKSESQKGQNLAPEHRAELVHTARLLSRAQRRARDATAKLQESKTTADSLSGEVQSILSQRQERDLTRAIEKAGTLVANLRRRIQLDERLDQMKRQYNALADDNHGILDRQLLPVWVLSGLGVIFALGVALIMLGTFLPELSSTGWSLAPLGLGGSMLAFLVKQVLERAAAQRFSESQRQLTMINQQMDELKGERESLDSQTARGSGPPQVRLSQAERDLATLEELMGQDSRRATATAVAENAQREAKEAEEALHSARRRWKQALGASGLPENLDPRQLKYVGQKQDQRETLRREIDHRRDELENKQRELRQIGERTSLMLRELGVVPSTASVADQMQQLRQTLDTLQGKWTRREQLRKRLKSLRLHERKLSKLQKRDMIRRRKLLERSNVADEPELRHRSSQADRLIELRLERDELTRQIALALGSHVTEDMVREQFTDIPPSQLERYAEEVADRRLALSQELQKVLEQRGRLGEQLSQIANDRRLAFKQLELSTIEQQLHDAIERWQVVAVTSRLLESIRKQFELDRQPQTLREASLFLARLTEGHYVRVWTPLDRDTLIVDDGQGQSLDIERLSRGTREQVFLSLRLALVAGFARRGINLPMVLDDIMVNFDAGRARAAAATLKDFAEAGNQIIIFTCHEHIAHLFLAQGTAAYKLPHNSEVGARAERMMLTQAVETPAVFIEPVVEAVEIEELPLEDLPVEEPAPVDDFLPDWEPLKMEPAPLVHRPRLDQTIYQIELPVEEPAPPVIVASPPPPPKILKRKKKKREVEPEPSGIRKRPRAPFAGTTWHEPVFDDGTVLLAPGRPEPYYEHVEELVATTRPMTNLSALEEYLIPDEPPFVEQAEDYEAA